jgi:hypothetical protein
MSPGSAKNQRMQEILIILEKGIAKPQREAVTRAAPPAQSVSERVFIARAGEGSADRIRAMPGVAMVLTGADADAALPGMSDAESLFAQAWLSRAGQVKQRPGEGLDWDTPPMQPPDAKPGR